MNAHVVASPPYRGRFAPSPTGPLHFGSLVAAVGSYLEAKIHSGEWLLRMEDLDPPREQPDAVDRILQTLEAYGFEWDGSILFQSKRHEAYATALHQLKKVGLLYPCACTRKEVADSAAHSIKEPVYPGTCRKGLHGRAPRAWRVRTTMDEIGFDDAIQKHQSQILEKDIGDFVLKRADGFYAYQLAVVIDDATQDITHVVRGADLLNSTARQIYLQRLLGLPTPAYTHLPVATNTAGEKLSKQTLALPLDMLNPSPALWHALDFLGQQPPGELMLDSHAALWRWALQNWRLDAVSRMRTIHSSAYR